VATEPRYEQPAPALSRRGARDDTIHVVSFNIAFSREIDRAIELLRSEPGLRDADILLLQEMDAEGTRRIADAMRMGFVYYPAIYHTRAERDFGNAVLSRWPIVADAKLILPHTSRYAGTQRIATAATIRVDTALVRVYSTHLSTILDAGDEARRDQLRAIVADAAPFARAIIGGDLNAGDVGGVVRDAGYAWPTERGPSTTLGGRWDHVFVRGLRLPDSAATGTIGDAHGASDHRPVWIRAVLTAARSP
jgi:endonuclease/exonuclease/phosphatase family metal-dependent hydrolase